MWKNGKRWGRKLHILRDCIDVRCNSPPVREGLGVGKMDENRRDLHLGGFALITHALEGHVRLEFFVQILATLWINVLIVAIDCTA